MNQPSITTCLNLLNPIRTIFLVFLVGIPLGSLAVSASGNVSHAVLAPIRLEVWNPDLRSSNITSLSRFPVGSQFATKINITNAGPINAFDITLSYNITSGPNVLQAITAGSGLSGGLFDPNTPPTGCSILVIRSQVDMPPGLVRFAAVVLGGCSVNGTGTLFTVLFRVTGIGATSITFVRTSSDGKLVTSVIGPTPNFPVLPIQPVDAYFRNKPGIPPVAFFTYLPVNPVLNDTVRFDASLSFDPNNSSLPGRGISRYLWVFGDGSTPGQATGVQTNHTFTFFFNTPAIGGFSVRLVVWDVDEQLPSEIIVVVNIAPGISNFSSLNWSGYAVSGPLGSVSDVKGSWIVPAIVGACPSTQTDSSFWVGIDGFTSPTVEQTGTESACVNGVPTYFAWYEFFPKNSIIIPNMAVRPGDIMSAEVRFSKNKFTVSISDLTTGASFSKSAPAHAAQRSSAEWIAEAPSSTTGILPLANFGTVVFGQDYTGVQGTGTATVGNLTGPIGSFGSSAFSILMVASGTLILAQPSSLTADKTSFVVRFIG